MCRKHLSSSLAKLGLPPSVPAHLVGPRQFTKTSQLCQSPHTLCSGSFNFSGKSLMDFLTREMNQSLLEVLDGISWSKWVFGFLDVFNWPPHAISESRQAIIIAAQAKQGVEGEKRKSRSAKFAPSGWRASYWFKISPICLRLKLSSLGLEIAPLLLGQLSERCW